MDGQTYTAYIRVCTYVRTFQRRRRRRARDRRVQEEEEEGDGQSARGDRWPPIATARRRSWCSW